MTIRVSYVMEWKQACKSNKHLFDSFFILKTNSTEYSTKIHEAEAIRKHNPKLNAELYA